MLKEYSQYARFFDESLIDWTKDHDYNVMYLKHRENYCNELLRKRGYLFLRDVYGMLDIPITRESCEVGWIRDTEHYDICVRFIYDEEDESACILVDFNVVGYILDKI